MNTTQTKPAVGRPATVRQLNYLRALAQRTGTTFSPPATSRDASREIARMRRLDSAPREHDDGDGRADYATAPTEKEVTGHGARATWRSTRSSAKSAPAGQLASRQKAETVTARVLATHTRDDSDRQILAIPTSGGTLVIDRLKSGGDARLLARLGPEEPDSNADQIARMYIADTDARPPQLLRRSDLQATPQPAHNGPTELRWQTPLVAGLGVIFQVTTQSSAGIPTLGWSEITSGSGGEPVGVSLRTVVGELESYDPAVAITRAAIRAHRDDSRVRVAKLAAELQRVTDSPIVLNRGLRERVQHTVEQSGTTMSEIARRCGRLHTDRRGRQAGETSWLARRVGLLPEAGAPKPTPWVHVNVLAKIARDGLGISPHEVELPIN